MKERASPNVPSRSSALVKIVSVFVCDSNARWGHVMLRIRVSFDEGR